MQGVITQKLKPIWHLLGRELNAVAKVDFAKRHYWLKLFGPTLVPYDKPLKMHSLVGNKTEIWIVNVCKMYIFGAFTVKQVCNMARKMEKTNEV